MVRLLVNTIFAKVMKGHVPGKPLHKVSQPRTLMAERKTDRERREGECARLTLSHPLSVTRIQRSASHTSSSLSLSLFIGKREGSSNHNHTSYSFPLVSYGLEGERSSNGFIMTTGKLFAP